MNPNPTPTEAPSDPEWELRLQYWRRRLGRIRLGVEPVEDQVAKYRRATLMLSAVVLGLALIFLSLFTAFRRSDVGAVLVLVLLVPIVGFAWIDNTLLLRRVAAYQRDLREHERIAAATKSPRS